MQILSLSLENVKSYADATVEFTPGTNAVVGENGAGKSTILEAIGFALFDHISYNQADFVREGSRSATVTVTFVSSVDERAYQVIRRCGSSNLHYIFDPELESKVCEGKSDVLAFLKEHLGVDAGAVLKDLFRNAVGVPQGTLTAAFLDTPSNRKGTFDPLLRVEEYRNVYQSLRQPLSLLNERKQQNANQISELRGRLESLPDLKSEHKELQHEIARAQKELVNCASELGVVESSLREMDDLRQAINQAQSRVEAAALSEKNAEERRRTFEERVSQAEDARRIVEKHRPGHLAHQNAVRRREEIEEDLQARQRLAQERARMDESRRHAGQTIDRIIRELESVAKAEAEAASLEEAVRLETELHAELKEAETDFRTLAEIERTLDERRRVAAESKERYERLQKEAGSRADLERERSEVSAQIDSQQKDENEKRTSLLAHLSEIELLEKQTAALTESASALCPVCEEPLSEERRRELITRNKERLEALISEKVDFEKEIVRVKRTVGTATTRLRALESEIRQLPREEEVEAAAASQKQTEEAVLELEERRTELDGVGERVSRLRRQITALEEPGRRRTLALARGQQRQELENNKKRATEELNALDEKLTRIDGELKAFAELDTILKEIRSEIERHRKDDDLYRRYEQTAEQVEHHRAALQEATTALEQARQSHNESQTAYNDILSRFDSEHYREQKEAEQRLRSRHGTLSGQISAQERQLTTVIDKLKAMEKWQKELDAAEAVEVEFEAQEELLRSVRSVIQEAGPFVTKALVQQIGHGANQLFNDIMQDFTRHLHWHEDYGVTLEVDGRQRAFSQLSGGEQMSAALSIRLALLQEMSDISLAFFDEPTANLDENRRHALARQVLDIQGFRQLFVISHDDTFEQSTENLIRVQKIDGVSEIVA